ncbi:MAG: cyclic nucleotide-binding protein [Rhodospirillales bacterium]|nr:cyclic nucleotide-binding protein [Rhodospirillales bacterium]
MGLEQPGRQGFSAGAVVFREGDAGHCAYLIEEGAIVISKRTPEGWVELGRLGAHTIFGEMSIIDGQPRMATATAMTDTILIPVNQPLLEKKLAAADPFLRSLLLILIRSIRSTSDKLHIAV